MLHAERRVCTVDEAFKVVVHVASARDYRDLLPGGARYALLVEAIDAFAPPQLEWEIELAVTGDAIRPARLGGSAQLGWSSWGGPVAPQAAPGGRSPARTRASRRSGACRSPGASRRRAGRSGGRAAATR